MRAAIKLYVRTLSILESCRAKVMSAICYSDDDSNSAIGPRHYAETMLLRDAVAHTAGQTDYCTLKFDCVHTFTGFQYDLYLSRDANVFSIRSADPEFSQQILQCLEKFCGLRQIEDIG